MKKLWIIVCMLVFLCGCASGEENYDVVDFAQMPTILTEDAESIPVLNAEPKGATAAPRLCAPAEEGMFLLKWDADNSNSDAFLHFCDFSSGETYPVCTKPNCTHSDYLCSAYLKDVSYLYCDGSYIYYFSGNAGQLWRMNPDGTDRKMLFQSNEHVETGAMQLIHGVVFYEEKVYFNSWGAAPNSETGELESGDRIWVGDLQTGELRMLPIVFPENKGSSTLDIFGIYDDQLIARHSSILVSLGPVYQKNKETVFMLDVNTLEVTVLYQWEWDTTKNGAAVSFVTDGIDEGYMLFKHHAGSYQRTAYPDGTEESVWSGTRIFIDLSGKQAYRMTNQDALSLEEEIIDGKWVYLQWNEDHTAVEKCVRDLQTGKIARYPAAMQDVIWNSYIQNAGDHYIVHVRGDGKGYPGRILKTDFWEDKAIIHPFPEWVLIG